MSSSLPRLGIALLDAQHDQLANLREGMRARPPRERFNQWNLLAEEFLSHFREESDLMREARFPDAQRHEADHADLVRSMMSTASTQSEGGQVTDDDLDRLARWMESHLRGPDTTMAEFLLDPGLWHLREDSQWEAFTLAHPD